eukprot:5937877-Ditylum_brightwellii.AAC.1
MSLANQGNYSGAIKVLTQNTPVASVSNENKGLLDKYYPQQGANLLPTKDKEGKMSQAICQNHRHPKRHGAQKYPAS